jgi:putrescine aminotransferase
MSAPEPPVPSARKRRVLDLARRYVIPGRVDVLERLGVPLVIGRREGYRIWDLDGHELLDFHLNGGTFNVGHRHPAVVEAMLAAARDLDIGNHHFPSEARALFAERLAALSPGELRYTVFASGGSEANDIAIKSARWATGRRKIVAVAGGYHGRTGLSGAAGDAGTARFFHTDYPDEFRTVPFGDLAAMEGALAGDDVAAVLMETIPATYGFPIPADDYLPGVRRLCTVHGALYVADEVQTGLGRTGRLWGVEGWGVEPDVMVVGKGLSGGMYPIAAAIMTEAVGRWLVENPWGHVSTFGGAEIGAVVGMKTLDLCSSPEALANAIAISDHLGAGLEAIRRRHPFLVEIRRKGLVMGLRFGDPYGGVTMSGALYRAGVWAMFAGFDTSVLQWKPGLFVDRAYCDEALERFERAIAEVERTRGSSEA